MRTTYLLALPGVLTIMVARHDDDTGVMDDASQHASVAPATNFYSLPSRGRDEGESRRLREFLQQR